MSLYANGSLATTFHTANEEQDIFSNSEVCTVVVLGIWYIQTNFLQLVSAPYCHVASLPSKGIREILIGSMNKWFHLESENIKIISDVIKLLHNSSLL